MSEPTPVELYDVMPRQWVRVDDQIAAMLPYPSLEGALCINDLSWVEEVRGPRTARDARMKATCAECPALLACREYGIAHESFGVWGGLTEEERIVERKVRGQLLVEPQSAYVYGLSDNMLAMLTQHSHLNEFRWVEEDEAVDEW